MGDLGDNTQSEDNDALQEFMLEHPTFNPLFCDYVTPKRINEDSTKVEIDTALTIDYLNRASAVDGFKTLPLHLKDDILSKCWAFHTVTHNTSDL